LSVLVRSFLKWYRNAPVEGRIEAVGAMVEAYLAGQLGGDSEADAEAALTLVLDDASAAVRRVLSRAFALAPNAPRHIVVALAHDVSQVSGLVLARSPHLGEADLIECARRGDKLTHLAIAMRAGVTEPVSAALTEVADADVLVALIRNTDAELSDMIFARMVERYPASGVLRHALSARSDLPAHVRQSLVASLSVDLLGLVTGAGWLDPGRAERIVGDGAEMATIALAAAAPDLGVFVSHLIASRQLTPTLVLRALLCRDTTLFGAALTALTGFAPARVAGILKGRGGAPLVALCDKAGLPRWMIPAYAAALAAQPRTKPGTDHHSLQLDRAIIGAVLSAVLAEAQSEAQPLIALLRRFDAEAARDEARAMAEVLIAEGPEMIEAGDGTLIDLDALAAELVLPESIEIRSSEAAADEPVELLPEMAAEAALPEPIAALAPTEAPAAVAEPEPAATATWSPPVRRIVHRLVPDQSRDLAGVLPEPDPSPAQGDAYRDELDALFAQAFGQESRDPAPSEGSLRVIERREDGLDEAFFANWTLRRNAA